MRESHTAVAARIAQAAFEGHQHECEMCRKWTGSTGELRNLCWRGTILFKEILNAQDGKQMKRQ